MRSLTKTIGAVLCLPVMLNSCYFNSTGRLIDNAQYEARANAADLNVSTNPVVYQNGSNYYIELPRYRYGHPVKLQYSVFDQESPMEASLEPRGMGMYSISETIIEFDFNKKFQVRRLGILWAHSTKMQLIDYHILLSQLHSSLCLFLK
jgi:hypothetical protein